MVGHHAVGVGVPVVFVENLLDCLHQFLRPGDVMHLLDPGDCLKEVGVHLIAEGAETALPVDGLVVVDLSGKIFDHGSVVWNSLSVVGQDGGPWMIPQTVTNVSPGSNVRSAPASAGA